MSKESLLLVDGDSKSLRVLEVSLSNAGFLVTTAEDMNNALNNVRQECPDLIISEVAMDDGSGFELLKAVKNKPEWAHIPFLFLTEQASVEHKIRGFELGVEDYLTKPIYMDEILDRVRTLLDKHRDKIPMGPKGRMQFSGGLDEMGIVDLIQTLEMSRKSGLIHCTQGPRRGTIYFRNGKIIDADCGSLNGESAVYRLMTWKDGTFEVEFRQIRRNAVITLAPQALLMEGMRRLDEWTQSAGLLPPLDTQCAVNTTLLAEKLSQLPDQLNSVLRYFNGKRSLAEVIELSAAPDLETLQTLAQLYKSGLIAPVKRRRSPQTRPPAFAYSDDESSLEGKSVRGATAPTGSVTGPTSGNGRITLRETPLRSPGPAHDGVSDSQPPSIDSGPTLVDSGPTLADLERSLAAAPLTAEAVDSDQILVESTHSSDRVDPLEEEVTKIESDRFVELAIEIEPEQVESEQLVEFAIEVEPKDSASKPEAFAQAAPSSQADNLTKPSADVQDPTGSPGSAIPTQPLAVKTVNNREYDENDDMTPLPQPRPYVDELFSRRVLSSEGAAVASVSGMVDLSNSARTRAAGDRAADVAIDDAEEDTEQTAIPQSLLSADEQHKHLRHPDDQEASATSSEDDVEVVVSSAVSMDDLRPTVPAVRSAETTAEIPRSGRRRTFLYFGVVGIATVAAIILLSEYPRRLSGPVPVPVAHQHNDVDAASAAPSVAAQPDAAAIAKRPDTIAPPIAKPAVVKPATVKPAVVKPAAVKPAVVKPAATKPPRTKEARKPDRDKPPRTTDDRAELDPATEYKRLLKRARSLKRSNPSRALALIDKSLQSRETSSAYALKADILRDTGRPEAALKAASAAVRVGPGRSSSWLTKGLIHYQLRQYASAKAAFQRYLQMKPNSRRSESVRALLDTL